MIISSNTWNEAALVQSNPPQYNVVEQIIFSKFLLNLAGCYNILFNRNFAAEIVGRMQKRQLVSSSIAIRNASDDVQVFNEMFVICYVHSFVASEISRPGLCGGEILALAVAQVYLAVMKHQSARGKGRD